MTIMILYLTKFDLKYYFDLAISYHPKGENIMKPGTFLPDTISALSLGLALMFGTAGLPHILMRFFTVKDAKEARKSVFYATGFIGYFYILTFIIGFGAIALLLGNTQFTSNGNFNGSTNMIAITLADVLGGDIFLGFISAVAFTVGLAFAIAASVNFPILLLCIYWKNLTTKGAFWGGLIGLIVVLSLVILSPSIWVKSFGFNQAIFPYDHPALFSMPLSFLLIYIISKLDHSKRAKKDKEGFKAQDFKAQSGIDISEAIKH
ncbi:hypothetical protein CAHE111092_05640 [Campylobacter hepaticus]